MLTWVIYDIVKNKARFKVSRACEQAGIYRVQKSVFLGDLNSSQLRSLQTELEDIINKDEDSVYIFPMSKDEFSSASFLGQAFDRELITDELKTLLL